MQLANIKPTRPQPPPNRQKPDHIPTNFVIHKQDHNKDKSQP
jgi:hypothetical protein